VKKYLTLALPDGSVYGLPVSVVAENRAAFYAGPKFNGDMARSLAEDTLPLFEADPYCAKSWARENMDFDEVAPHLVCIRERAPSDLRTAWGTIPALGASDNGPPDLPPPDPAATSLDQFCGRSEEVLVRLRNGSGILRGRYFHKSGEWRCDHLYGIVEVAEWWPLPKKGTGTRVPEVST
jgi:hypothetical protein